MRALAAILGLWFALVLAAPAWAALSEDDLLDVALRPAANAAVPADIPFTDENDGHIALGAVTGDRATLLILADYDCRTICGPILATAKAAIQASGLVAGRDFNLVVIGIDPSEPRADAAAMKIAQFGDDSDLAAAHFLEGDAAAIKRLSVSIGYHARYDAQVRQYAHPTDLLVLTPDRRVSRLLPGLAVSGDELRFALDEAGDGLVGSLVNSVRLLCYGLDPAHGVYNAPVRAALIGGGGATLALVGAMAAIAQRRRKRLIGGGNR